VLQCRGQHLLRASVRGQLDEVTTTRTPTPSPLPLSSPSPSLPPSLSPPTDFCAGTAG
jgi:hypothetical protein